MNLQNFVPPPRGLGSEKKFWESLESTDESFSRGHWRGLMIYKPIEFLKSLIEYLCMNYLVHTENNLDHSEASEKQKKNTLFGK